MCNQGSSCLSQKLPGSIALRLSTVAVFGSLMVWQCLDAMLMTSVPRLDPAEAVIVSINCMAASELTPSAMPIT